MTAPEGKLVHLPPVCNFITVQDETDNCPVICKIQELDRGVVREAAKCVDGEEHWRKVLDVNSPSLSCCFLSVCKLEIH